MLGALLKLLHPLMPFVTEELWLELAKRRGRRERHRHARAVPASADDFAADARAEEEIDWLKGFVGGIRQIRGEIEPAALGDAARAARRRDATAIVRASSVTPRQLRKLAGLERIEFVAATARRSKAPPPRCSARCGSSCRSRGSSTSRAERDRLGKQLAKTRDDLGKVQRKLENQSFVANAPAEIVAKEHARIAELDAARHAARAAARAPRRARLTARPSRLEPSRIGDASPSASRISAGDWFTEWSRCRIGVSQRSDFRRPFAAWLHLH